MDMEKDKHSIKQRYRQRPRWRAKQSKRDKTKKPKCDRNITDDILGKILMLKQVSKIDNLIQKQRKWDGPTDIATSLFYRLGYDPVMAKYNDKDTCIDK